MGVKQQCSTTTVFSNVPREMLLSRKSCNGASNSLSSLAVDSGVDDGSPALALPAGAKTVHIKHTLTNVFPHKDQPGAVKRGSKSRTEGPAPKHRRFETNSVESVRHHDLRSAYTSRAPERPSPICDTNLHQAECRFSDTTRKDFSCQDRIFLTSTPRKQAHERCRLASLLPKFIEDELDQFCTGLPAVADVAGAVDSNPRVSETGVKTSRLREDTGSVRPPTPWKAPFSSIAENRVRPARKFRVLCDADSDSETEVPKIPLVSSGCDVASVSVGVLKLSQESPVSFLPEKCQATKIDRREVGKDKGHEVSRLAKSDSKENEYNTCQIAPSDKPQCEKRTRRFILVSDSDSSLDSSFRTEPKVNPGPELWPDILSNFKGKRVKHEESFLSALRKAKQMRKSSVEKKRVMTRRRPKKAQDDAVRKDSETRPSENARLHSETKPLARKRTRDISPLNVKTSIDPPQVVNEKCRLKLRETKKRSKAGPAASKGKKEARGRTRKCSSKTAPVKVTRSRRKQPEVERCPRKGKSQQVKSSRARPKESGEFQPEAWPGTQRYRAQQLQYLVQNSRVPDAAAADDLFSAGVLGEGDVPATGDALLDLPEGHLQVALTPSTSSSRALQNLRPHTPMEAFMQAAELLDTRTPVTKNCLISPGNPLNSAKLEDGVRYRAHRQKAKKISLRRRAQLVISQAEVPVVTATADFDQMAQLVGEAVAGLQNDDDEDESSDEYFPVEDYQLYED